MAEMRCAACGGRYEKRRVTVELHTPEGDLLVARNVAAEVCVQCGDELFTSRVTNQLLRLTQFPPAPVGTLTVPVYDLGVLA